MDVQRLLIAAACILLASCTVKEDRTVCPSWVTVRSNGYVCNGVSSESLRITFSSDNDVAAEGTASWQDFIGGKFVIQVPRKHVFFCGLTGYDESHRDNDCITVPEGLQFDRVFGFYDEQFLIEEERTFEEPVNKHHAVLILSVVGYNKVKYPFVVKLVSNTDGIMLYRKEGHAGRFAYTMNEGDDGKYRCVLPRQCDGSLCLCLFRSSGEEVTTIPVGEQLAQSGYDWAKDDLDDIPVILDFSKNEILIEVNDWETYSLGDIKI